MIVLQLQGRLGKLVLKISSLGRRHSQCGKFSELRKNFKKVMESLSYNLCGSLCCSLFLSLYVHMELSQSSLPVPESQTVSHVMVFPPAMQVSLLKVAATLSVSWGLFLTFTGVTPALYCKYFPALTFLSFFFF